MTTKTKERIQIGLEDRLCNDKELEDLLEQRQILKEKVTEYNKKDKDTKKKIAEIKLELPYRCGRFIISKMKTDARDVEFHTVEGERISIKLSE